MAPCCKAAQDMRPEANGQNTCKARGRAGQRDRGEAAGAQEGDDEERDEEDERRAEVVHQGKAAADGGGIDNEQEQVPPRYDAVHRGCTDIEEAELDQLGRLERDAAKRDPVARAVVLLPEHQIDEQQKHAADGGQIAKFLRAGQVAQRPADDQIDHDAAEQADELLCEIGGIIRGDDGKAERTEEKGQRFHLVAAAVHHTQHGKQQPAHGQQAEEAQHDRLGRFGLRAHPELQRCQELEDRQQKQGQRRGGLMGRARAAGKLLLELGLRDGCKHHVHAAERDGIAVVYGSHLDRLAVERDCAA